MSHFRRFCLEGITPNHGKIEEYLTSSLMLVTSLSPKIGYEKAAELAHHAHEKGMSLKEAVLDLEILSEEEFDEICDPIKMV